jgi:sugar-specific transcriptional regulator TrmB
MEKPRGFIRTHEEKTDPWRFVRKDKGRNKQLEMIEDALSTYGLSVNEVKVYLYLARTGEKKASEIAEAISLHRTETYRILRDLEKRGIVFSAFEKPLKFTAVPLEKTIEQLIETQKMKLRLLEKEKVDLIQLWASMPKPKIEGSKKEIFQILEGESETILKADELLEKTQTEVQIFAPEKYLAQLYHSDFMDNLERYSYNLSINLLTENSLKSRFFLEHIGWTDQGYCIGDVKKLPCFIISDRETVLIIYRKDVEDKGKGCRKKLRVVALWTNCSALVETMLMLFARLAETGETFEESLASNTSELAAQMQDEDD